MKPLVYLAAVGDTNSASTWSGIPYFFLQAGRAKGLFDGGLSLSTTNRGWKARRIAWNLKQVLGGDRSGGYQYSTSFLEKLWEPARSQIEGAVVVNCFQLFPPSIVANQKIEKWFFVDQTLQQLFDHYGLRSTIGRRVALEAIEREREGYHAARGIIVHSNWAANSMIDCYGVARERVHVVVPGASLDATEYQRWETEKPPLSNGVDVDAPVRLVFVGKEWRRKGLDRLLRALRVARRSGSTMTLRVIGCPRETLPAELRDVDGVEWLGFIDKKKETGKLLRAVSECDVGCLLSVAEAGGIALREYHALGLPVMGTEAGGAPEHTIPGASIVVSTQAGDDELASVLLSLETDRVRLAKLRHIASVNRRSALWDASVDRVCEFWPHDLSTRPDASSTDDGRSSIAKSTAASQLVARGAHN